MAIDLPTPTPYSASLSIQGEFIKQLRRDPIDPDGVTVLALTTGIERIDLSTGDVAWAVPETTFAAAGIEHRWQPQAFDVDATGSLAHVAAYDGDFEQVRLYRVELDGDTPPQEVASGFDSVERTLEVVGDRLYYGSTRAGEPGLWIFEVTGAATTVLDGPISTGLPPYSMAVLP